MQPEINNDSQPYYICGIHPVLEALRAGYRCGRIFLQKGREDERFEQIITIAKKNKIQFFFTDNTELDKLQQAHHQGVVAELKEGTRYIESISGFLARVLKEEPDAAVLILDGITDKQNLGAITRSACFFGIRLIITEAHGSAPVDAAVHRISSGASLLMPFSRAEKLSTAVNELKTLGFKIYSAVTPEAGGVPLHGFSPQFPCACILGSEGNGVRPHLIRASDATVHIAGSGLFNSLNAAAAGAVFCEHFYSTQPKAG